MKIRTIGLIGFGVIGSPIAHKMNLRYGRDFCIVASGDIRAEIENTNYTINGETFNPKIVSDKCDLESDLDLLLVCVKNYHLQNALTDIKRIVSKETIILPLQNGIYSFDFFTKHFPENIILKGYMQGPNTEIGEHGIITYKNPGVIHVGSNNYTDIAIMAYNVLNEAKFPVKFENDINHMVWSKWMLNVVGNSVTALTNADYKMFKYYDELQELCKKAMEEFILLAESENMSLTQADVTKVLDYYINYDGSKKTSMLVDVIKQRKTENDFLAGYAVKLARKNSIKVPMIETLYLLIKIKESLYMNS